MLFYDPICKKGGLHKSKYYAKILYLEMKMKGYKEEVLTNLGVYELRELARQLGVSAPTTKKENNLNRRFSKFQRAKNSLWLKRATKAALQNP